MMIPPFRPWFKSRPHPDKRIPGLILGSYDNGPDQLFWYLQSFEKLKEHCGDKKFGLYFVLPAGDPDGIIKLTGYVTSAEYAVARAVIQARALVRPTERSEKLGTDFPHVHFIQPKSKVDEGAQGSP